MCPMSAIIVMEQMSCPSRNIRAIDFDIIVVADVVWRVGDSRRRDMPDCTWRSNSRRVTLESY